MSLESIALEGIERHAKWLEYSARSITHFVNMMAAQRTFMTTAEENLNLAEKALTKALENVRATREHYKSLPAGQ